METIETIDMLLAGCAVVMFAAAILEALTTASEGKGDKR